MPVDFRRINGPEKTIPYRLYSPLNLISIEERLSKVFKDKKRQDGRDSNIFRKIFIKPNIISQAKGSAYMEQGKTKVIVSVYDPREIPSRARQDVNNVNGELYCEFKFATFSCPKRRIHQQDAQEKEYTIIMKRALESAVCRNEFANFQVDIFALVLENDGSALSTAITCAGVALAQAGIPMYDLITSLTIAKQNEYIFIDPTYEEEDICNQEIINQSNQKLTYRCLKLQAGDEMLQDYKYFETTQSQQKVNDGSEDSYEDSDNDDHPPRLQLNKLYISRLNSSKSKTKTEETMKKKSEETVDGYEHGTILISMLHTHEQISEFYQTGSMSLATTKQLTNLLIESNKQLLAYVQKVLYKFAQEQLSQEE